jgi:hypothetical protein
MMRMPFVCAVMLALLGAGSCKADILPLFSDVPTTYVPGTAFTFQITLPAINGLTAYNVDLIFDAAVNTPDLSVSAAAPSSEYVFTTTGNFSSNSFSGPGLNEVSVQFNDSTSNPVSVVTGVNDVLGIVTVNPGSDLTGPITVSFDSSTSVDYFSEGRDNTPDPVTIDQGQPPAPPVPTPAGLVTMAIGFFMLAARQQVKRRLC